MVRGAVKAAVLVFAMMAAVLVRLVSVVRYESIIHEFDPW
jgi:hypothetical protein